MRNCSFFILIIFLLTGCGTTKEPAPIVYHHKKGSGVSTINTDEKVISSGPINSELINDNDYIIPDINPTEKNKKIIYHEVKAGETIEDIASKYKQTVDEIVMLNELYPPYYLDKSQIIKIKVFNKDSNSDQDKKTDKSQTLSFIVPVQGKIISKFGDDTAYGKNKGINIAAKQGTKIVASSGGKVIYADYDATFGYLVLVKLTGQNIVTSYAHLEDIILNKGDSVKQGDVIGYVGNTGKVNSSQLHFGIREGKNAKNPMQYVKY